MSYATRQDLVLRAGRLNAAWTANSTPSTADLDSLLAENSALIDGVLKAWSVNVPVADATALAALAPLNARMALLEALRATFPSRTGPQEASELIDTLQEQLYGKDGNGGEWASLVAGTHPAVTALIQTGSVPEASSFWNDEPDYGMLPDPVDLLNTNPMMLPLFSRLSKF